MTAENLIKALPVPTKPEEILIYNFLQGKDVSSVQVVKSKDLFLQALLVYLAEQSKKQTTVEPPKKTVKKSKE